MKKFYVPSALLTVKDSQVVAIFDTNRNKTQIIANKSWLIILEIFIHEQSLEAAYQRFQQMDSSLISEHLLNQCKRIRYDLEELLILLAHKTLKISKQGLSGLMSADQHSNFSAISQENPYVLLCLFDQENLIADEQKINTFEDFSQTVEYLETLGLLSPAVNTLDWGDLKRRFPICHKFGFTRGTPVDRYYLDKFISEIRHQVVGSVLEIGGVLLNKEIYQLSVATEYQTLDLVSRPGVTVVGDAHDSTIIMPESLDTVLVFNVLEHCHNPWVVVQNIYSWLRVGGKCFCMVPSAQKLHSLPKDYWRPLPDGMKQLFQDFSESNLHIYGNPLTVLASFMGVAAEELSPQDLDDFHPDYPVATCIAALK
ncbi:methyltransferase domain-containing protein [Brasilonema sp. UFV-L1]|uniref:methyltransferase domain-containing protein n=1 Tax=Brasilonema sp. UFV-L1 TaxID=2234130 RepID=UPI00145DB2DE|nr:methyltransferase domain-containing protein [Brasilonema sp. UFV-L1]